MTGAEQPANVTAGFRVAADEGIAGETTGVSPPRSARAEAGALPTRRCRGGKSKGMGCRGPGPGFGPLAKVLVLLGVGSQRWPWESAKQAPVF